MNNRIKISILLIITLIIGMVIGFLISGRLMSNRIENMRYNYSQTGFGKEINRIIQPTPEQREKLKPVFQDFAMKNRELMSSVHEDQKELFKELKEELSEILNDNQLKRLEDHWNKRRHWYEDRKGRNSNGNRRNRPGHGRGN